MAFDQDPGRILTPPRFPFDLAVLAAKCTVIGSLSSFSVHRPQDSLLPEISSPIQRQRPAGITGEIRAIERVCQRYWRGISALRLPAKSTRARLRCSPPAALN